MHTHRWKYVFYCSECMVFDHLEIKKHHNIFLKLFYVGQNTDFSSSSSSFQHNSSHMLKLLQRRCLRDILEKDLKSLKNCTVLIYVTIWHNKTLRPILAGIWELTYEYWFYWQFKTGLSILLFGHFLPDIFRVRGCSHMTSAKNWGAQTPPLPLPPLSEKIRNRLTPPPPMVRNQIWMYKFFLKEIPF